MHAWLTVKFDVCSMLSIIAAGYLVNCDFHAWRVAYDILAAGLPVSIYEVLESFVMLDWMGFGRTKVEVRMVELASSHWEKSLNAEYPFGYPVSGP